MVSPKVVRVVAATAVTAGLLGVGAGVAGADPAPGFPANPVAGQQCPPPPGDQQGQPPQGQPPQGQPPQGQPPEGQPPEGQPPQCPGQ